MKHWTEYKWFTKCNIITFEFGKQQLLFEFINQQQDTQFSVVKKKNSRRRVAWFYSTPITEKYELEYEE